MQACSCAYTCFLVTYKDLSTTAHRTKVVDSVTYDKGYWVGEVYRDVVTVPGSNGSAAVAVATSFAAIISTSNFFEKTVGNTGIWGLGYRTTAEDLSPLFDGLVEGGAVDSDEFSLVLCGNYGHLWLGALTDEQRMCVYDSACLLPAFPLLFLPANRRLLWPNPLSNDLVIPHRH